METLRQKLSKIQIEFKAVKSRYNSFGKYNFRSAEDILEALKPINEKYKVFFTINETLIKTNPPIFRSVATIYDCESENDIDSQAIVGVDLEQKGMSTPQRYGAASSYAKKYALGNLLLIDDTADADATNTHETKKVLKKDTAEFTAAVEYLKKGNDIANIEAKYTITAEVKNELLTKLNK